MARLTKEHPPLGLDSGTVRVVPYDPAWPALFDVEVSRIGPFLTARDVRLRLEHTGSTAVPGLAAKPILDILAGYDDDGERAPTVAALEAAGYTYRGEQGIPGRDFFRRGEPRQYHVHLTRVGSTFWNDHLTFRDYLRSASAAVEAYAALKMELAARYPTERELYIEGKAEFVRDTLARARGEISRTT
jgi:GrpB-like predicted nucleotidyltransferase (UPF0157 family)